MANTTLVNTRDAGFTTVYPAGTPRPLTSNLNATESAQLIANHTIVPVDVRGMLSTREGQPYRGRRDGLVQHPADLEPHAADHHAAPPLPTCIVVPVEPRHQPRAQAFASTRPFDSRLPPGQRADGSPGNTVIAGRPLTSHTHPFLSSTPQPGDEPTCTPTAVHVQGAGVGGGARSDYNTIVAWLPQPTVTLYACYPLGSIAERWVVSNYVGDA